MKDIFTPRFFKYAIATFLLVLVISALGAVNHYYDLSLANAVPLKVLCRASLYLSLGLTSKALCISIALASFVSFKKLSENNHIKVFFKKLCIGFICLLPFAVGVYLFDSYIAPRLQVRAMESLWELRTGRSIQEMGKESQMQIPSLENYSASLSTKKVLDFRLDSIQTEYNQLKTECSQLLAQLPDTTATEAYDTYNLKRWGIDYRHAASSMSQTEESITDIRENKLFETVEKLYETYGAQLSYQLEENKRKINAIALLLEFLLFAILGYLFRRKTIRNVLGILAIIVVAGLFIQQITAIGEQYAENTGQRVKAYEKEMRSKLYKKR